MCHRQENIMQKYKKYIIKFMFLLAKFCYLRQLSKMQPLNKYFIENEMTSFVVSSSASSNISERFPEVEIYLPHMW